METAFRVELSEKQDDSADGSGWFREPPFAFCPRLPVVPGWFLDGSVRFAKAPCKSNLAHECGSPQGLSAMQKRFYTNASGRYGASAPCKHGSAQIHRLAMGPRRGANFILHKSVGPPRGLGAMQSGSARMRRVATVPGRLTNLVSHNNTGPPHGLGAVQSCCCLF